jgi:hypothetical protein
MDAEASFSYATGDSVTKQLNQTKKSKLMTVDKLKAAYAALPGKLIKGRSDNLFRIEENKPATFFILIGGADSFPDIAPDGYSSKGVWVHPIRAHFLGKTNICDPNGCYICEEIKELEANLAALKQETDETIRSDPEQGNDMLLQVREFEKQIQGISCQETYAINVLVKGQESPVVYEAPKSVAEPIYQIFETALTEDGINIFDPLRAPSFTISGTNRGHYIEYTVTTSPRPVPIINGERREERIKKAILAGTNLDDKYKFPTRTEQVTAWDAFINPPAQQEAQQPMASHAEWTREKPGAPHRCRASGEAVPPETKAAVVEQPPEPEPDSISDGNGADPEKLETQTALSKMRRSRETVKSSLARLRWR